MTTRPLDRPNARMLNHVEFVYAPGERSLVRRLFEGLGFRVLDPQTDPVPEALGPAAAPYLIIYLDPENEDLIDNVLYASEASDAQWRFESAIRDRMETDHDFAALHASLRSAFTTLPQAMTHVGIAYPSGDEIDAVVARLGGTPELANRVTLSDVFRPNGPGSVDDRVIQAFLYTDLISVGLLCGGQQIELQVRLDL